jgi:integrase
MAPAVAEALARLSQRPFWTGDDHLVLRARPAATSTPRRFLKRYKRALASAGLRQRRFHDLRHTFGTMMIRKADIVRVQGGWVTRTSRRPAVPPRRPAA